MDQKLDEVITFDKEITLSLNNASFETAEKPAVKDY